MRIFKTALIVLFAALLLIIGGFVVWGLTPSQPMPEATAALQSDSAVVVANADWLEFTPAGGAPDTGFIFYPGGHVDYRAYAPLARALAEKGYYVAITPMPLSLAVLAPAKAAAVISAHPEIKYWAVGGHSLGGAMAANFLESNSNTAQGLVLMASYPASSDNLSDNPLKVVSIYASNDGLATLDTIDASRALLPASTQWVEITGGNHAGFGWYGPQSGDQPAVISREDQQAQTVDAIDRLLSSLSEQP